MRKIGILMIIAVLSFIIGCPGEAGSKDKVLRIVTSFYPVYITALNVTNGAEGVSVDNLIPPSAGCPHDYSLTPDDMKKLSNADIFISNGAGAEPFTDKIIFQYPALRIIDLAQGIPLIGDDPHIWLSVQNVISQTRQLAFALEMEDPGNKDLYRKNADAYILKLESLRLKAIQELRPFHGKKIVTTHGAFEYFAAEFGIEIAASLDHNTFGAPSPKDVADIVDKIKREDVKAIFSASNPPDSLAITISRESGVPSYTLDPAVSGPDSPDAYMKIMENNLDTLKKAFCRYRKVTL